MSKKVIIIIVVVVLILGFIGFKFLSKNGEPKFELEKVEKGMVVKQVSETGVVKASEEIKLGFEASGKIEEVYVKIGDIVEENQKLVGLNIDDLSIQLREARAGLEIIKAQRGDTGVSLESANQNLKDVKASAKEDLDNAYQDALTVLNDAYLKVYDSYNIVDSLQRNYFSNPDSDGFVVMGKRNTINSALNKIKAYIDGIEDFTETKKIDLNLSNVKNLIENVKSALDIVKSIITSAGFNDLISATEKTSLDTNRTSVNTIYSDIISAQQAISTIKISNEKSINTAESQISGIENQLGSNDGLYEAQISQAQAKVSRLENYIKDASLKSPIKGKIVKIDKKAGEIVQTNESIVSVLSVEPFQIEVDIYEEDIVDVKVGNPVEVNLVAFPDQPLPGKVVSIDPAEKVVNEVVYYEITIDFIEESVIAKDLADQDKIRKGMTADIVIEVGKKENVLIVPRRAVEKINGQRIVQVLVGENVEERKIEIGLEGDEFIEIISGLKQGEEIIID
ncbi:MAG: efflux RND transporter periplasmic adaptor subunit [Candidatus Nealsonbacteria bacterium]